MVAWVAGYALRERAEQAEAAEQRAAQAEREREAAARVAVAEERTDCPRASRHRCPCRRAMVLQVGAVRHRLPDALAEDRDAQGRRAGRADSLAEMRRLLAAMRSDGDEAELLPQPGLDGLDSLLGEIGRAGLPVELHGRQALSASSGVDLSAYRIVQEGLTNALKHAHASDADVTVRYRPDELEIEAGTTARADRRATASGTVSSAFANASKSTAARCRQVRPSRAGSSSARASDPRPPTMTIRVLVADDQSMVRAGFRMLLAGEKDIDVVAEASNGLEAVNKAARFHPTVVLMDIRMPELDGLQATRRILAADNAARILILTTFDLDEYVFEALRAGASGFVLKDDSPNS